MTGVEQLAVFLTAAWLAVLTLVLLLVVRQIGLMTVRLSFAAPEVSAADVGLPSGTVVGQAVTDVLGDEGRDGTLVFFSATCGDCRSLAEGMVGDDLGDDVAFLIPGDRSLAEDISELLPPSATVRFDPEASAAAAMLGIDTVPFGVRILDRTIVAKSYVSAPEAIMQLSGSLNAKERLGAMSPNGHQNSITVHGAPRS